ncbi:MAG: hypothetical protein KF835_11590 [Xanthobacteraceae bacterium]|nr:hypothetical protein [Xanthobacteraceae bacterium]
MWFAPEYAVTACSMLISIFMLATILFYARLPLISRGLYTLGVPVGIYIFMCGVFLYFNWDAAESARLIAKYQMKTLSFLVPYLPYALIVGGALGTFAAWGGMLPEETGAATDSRSS